MYKDWSTEEGHGILGLGEEGSPGGAFGWAGRDVLMARPFIGYIGMN